MSREEEGLWTDRHRAEALAEVEEMLSTFANGAARYLLGIAPENDPLAPAMRARLMRLADGAAMLLRDVSDAQEDTRPTMDLEVSNG